MLFDLRLTPTQAVALGKYAASSPDDTPLLLAGQNDGSVSVGQGDARIVISPYGDLGDPDFRGND